MEHNRKIKITIVLHFLLKVFKSATFMFRYKWLKIRFIIKMQNFRKIKF